MDTNPNSLAQQLLQQLNPPSRGEQVEALTQDFLTKGALGRQFGLEKYPDPREFKFNEARDFVGLPMEHRNYADRNCNECYGRGVKRYVLVDGSMGVVFDDVPAPGAGARIVNNPKRILKACHCVHRGYSRVRLQYERDVEALVKTGWTIDAARELCFDLLLFPGLKFEMPKTPAAEVGG